MPFVSTVKHISFVCLFHASVYNPGKGTTDRPSFSSMKAMQVSVEGFESRTGTWP